MSTTPWELIEAVFRVKRKSDHKTQDPVLQTVSLQDLEYVSAQATEVPSSENALGETENVSTLGVQKAHQAVTVVRLFKTNKLAKRKGFIDRFSE